MLKFVIISSCGCGSLELHYISQLCIICRIYLKIIQRILIQVNWLTNERSPLEESNALFHIFLNRIFLRLYILCMLLLSSETSCLVMRFLLFWILGLFILDIIPMRD